MRGVRFSDLRRVDSRAFQSPSRLSPPRALIWLPEPGSGADWSRRPRHSRVVTRQGGQQYCHAVKTADRVCYLLPVEKFERSRIDLWLADFPAGEVDNEIERLNTRLEEIQHEIDDLQAEHGVLALELAKAEQAKMFYIHLRGIEESRDRVVMAAEVKAPRLRGKSAVMAIFRQGPPDMALRADDVRELMIERAWMDPGEDTHSIQVALSRLAREGRLERARQGVYRLPTSDQASAPTDVQSQNGEGSKGRGDPVLFSGSPASTLEGAPGEGHQAGS